MDTYALNYARWEQMLAKAKRADPDYAELLDRMDRMDDETQQQQQQLTALQSTVDKLERERRDREIGYVVRDLVNVAAMLTKNRRGGRAQQLSTDTLFNASSSQRIRMMSSGDLQFAATRRSATNMDVHPWLSDHNNARLVVTRVEAEAFINASKLNPQDKASALRWIVYVDRLQGFKL